MDNAFFDHPILNSPYEYPKRHWQLDEQGQPTQKIDESRRRAEFITPIPKPRKRKDSVFQNEIIFDEGKDDLLNLIVEIKGYRGEDAKEKRSTMDNYWVPGVNNLKKYGRWEFIEFTDVFEIESAFNNMVESTIEKHNNYQKQDI